MKKIVLLFVFLLSSRSLFADEPIDDGGVRIGVGTELQLALLNSPTGVLSIPIEWNRVRLEPSIGASWSRSKLDQTTEMTQSQIEVGLALHYVAHRTDASTFYLGLRTAGTRTSFDLPETAGLQGGASLGLNAGPLLGAAYRATDSLSIGLEFGVLGELSFTTSESAGLGGLGALNVGSSSGLRIRYLF